MSPETSQRCPSTYRSELDLPDSIHLCDLPAGHEGDHEDETVWWVVSQFEFQSII